MISSVAAGVTHCTAWKNNSEDISKALDSVQTRVQFVRSVLQGENPSVENVPELNLDAHDVSCLSIVVQEMKASLESCTKGLSENNGLLTQIRKASDAIVEKKNKQGAVTGKSYRKLIEQIRQLEKIEDSLEQRIDALSKECREMWDTIGVKVGEHVVEKVEASEDPEKQALGKDCEKAQSSGDVQESQVLIPESVSSSQTQEVEEYKDLQNTVQEAILQAEFVPAQKESSLPELPIPERAASPEIQQKPDHDAVVEIPREKAVQAKRFRVLNYSIPTVKVVAGVAACAGIGLIGSYLMGYT